MTTRILWSEIRSPITGLPYEAAIYEDGPGTVLPCGSVRFQHDVSPEEEINGTTLEALITLCRDRLQMFQSNPVTTCLENGMAIDSLDTALEWLKRRHQERVDQGVYGQYVPHVSPGTNSS